MMIIYLACLLAWAASSSSENGQVIGEPGNGEKIPLDITLKKDHMISISGAPDPQQSFFQQSINMYDLQKHLEAVKINDDRVCYIKLFTPKYKEVKKMVDNVLSHKSKVMTGVVEQWNIPGQEIKPAELEDTVGTKIAKFCSGYRVFWMEEGHIVTNDDANLQRERRGWSVSVGASISVGGVSVGGTITVSGGRRRRRRGRRRRRRRRWG